MLVPAYRLISTPIGARFQLLPAAISRHTNPATVTRKAPSTMADMMGGTLGIAIMRRPVSHKTNRTISSVPLIGARSVQLGMAVSMRSSAALKR